jgi:dTDP-glucose 4,6-dehydratase
MNSRCHIVIGGNGFLGRELIRQIMRRGDIAIACDLHPKLSGELMELGANVEYVQIDVEDRRTLDRIPLNQDCIVHHLASRLIVPNEPRFGREAYFHRCIVDGTRNVIDWLEHRDCLKFVFWSTDMVYGPALVTSRDETHPRRPYGPYGRAKVLAEDLAMQARSRGMDVTILRPRLILGPGRLGILETLFKLMQRNLPIPLIGDGSNRFQFVSVADCARASLLAVDKGFPNVQLNLGSSEPMQVYDLMRDLLRRSGSRSLLLRTPGPLVKATLRLLHLLTVSPMDPEQFEIADQDVTLDIGRAAAVLEWKPEMSDHDMLLAAWTAFQNQRTRNS